MLLEKKLTFKNEITDIDEISFCELVKNSFVDIEFVRIQGDLTKNTQKTLFFVCRNTAPGEVEELVNNLDKIENSKQLQLKGIIMGNQNEVSKNDDGNELKKGLTNLADIINGLQKDSSTLKSLLSLNEEMANLKKQIESFELIINGGEIDKEVEDKPNNRKINQKEKVLGIVEKVDNHILKATARLDEKMNKIETELNRFIAHISTFKFNLNEDDKK